MRKRLFTAVMAGMMTLALSVPAFAGEWKQDGAGWWYQNDDGSYPNSGWTWVDGKCYYFTPEGYCLVNTQTPDGYTVDENGAWVVGGVVQMQEPGQSRTVAAGTLSKVSLDGLTFTVPDGYVQDPDGETVFINIDQMVFMGVASEDLGEMGKDPGSLAILNWMQQDFLDSFIEEEIGTPTAKEVKQFSSGTWYCYEYADASVVNFPMPGSVKIYLRINGSKLQMAVFGGNLTGMNTDEIMNNNLR